MILAQFIEQLSDTGHPRFDSSDPPSDLTDCSAETEAALRQVHQAEMLAAPHSVPALSLSFAHHGLALMCRLSQFLVFREIPAESVTGEIERLLSGIPAEENASALWSLDLSLRHLPALYRFATNASMDDPLVVGILNTAKRFPLSSVGIPLKVPASAEKVSEIHQPPTLSALYVDRIIDTVSVDRLNDPLTCRCVKEAIGHFPELAPKIATALARPEFTI